MKKIVLLATLGLLTVAVSAQAAPNYTPAPPPHNPPPAKPHPGDQPKPHPKEPHHCVPHQVGYHASGTLVSASLTAEGHNRYSGTLEVDIRRANHGAPKGDQTFTLTGARVKFHHGVDPGSLEPGGRVHLHGRITKLARGCPSGDFTPTITLKKVDLSRARHPKG